MNRLNYYFEQSVTEAELDKGFQYAADALAALASEAGAVGVVSGMTVTQTAVPGMSVDVSTGVAYDHAGARVPIAAAPPSVSLAFDHNLVPTAVASPGNFKYVTLFVLADEALSDPRVDGNSLTVYFERSEWYRFKVVQSAEGASPTPPPADSENGVRLCDVLLAYGQSTISTGDVLITGREDAFCGEDWNATPAPINIREGNVRDFVVALQAEVNNILQGGSPVPAIGVDYAGGPAWANGTTNPATTVEAQLDKIVSDLATTTAPAGAVKVGARTRTSGALSLSTTTVDGQLFELLVHVAAAGTPPAADVSYAGGAAWADGTTNPSTTVEAQLDKIVSDLAASTGTAKIGGAAVTSSPSSLSAGTLAAQIVALLGLINARGVLDIGNTWTRSNDFDNGSQLYPDVNAAIRLPKTYAGARTLMLEQAGPDVYFRLYSESDGSVAFTWNALWTAVGNTWQKDDTAFEPLIIRIGPVAPFFSMRRYELSGSATFSDMTDLAGKLEMKPGYSPHSSPPTTTLDGAVSYVEGPGLVTTHVETAGYAGAVSTYSDTHTFPKRFPATPSSVTVTPVSTSNISGSILNAVDVSSVTLLPTVSGTGMYSYIVDVDVQ